MSNRVKVGFYLTVAVGLLVTLGFVRANNLKRINPSSASAAAEQDVRGLVFAVHPNGCAPAETTTSQGRYTFIVHNRTGLSELTFTLNRKTGERLHELRTNKRRWNARFDLQPGTYVLSVTGHSEWQCVITVTPN